MRESPSPAIAAGVAPAPDGPLASHSVLIRANQMTQQMPVPGPLSGHEYAHAGDEQLQLSANPEFLREIEAYQDQIDRMLARPR